MLHPCNEGNTSPNTVYGFRFSVAQVSVPEARELEFPGLTEPAIICDTCGKNTRCLVTDNKHL